MNLALHMTAIVLLLTLLLGVWRLWRGPGDADRLLAGQLFGTTGVALLLVLAAWRGQPALRDVGLVVALLSALIVVAFVARVRPLRQERRP